MAHCANDRKPPTVHSAKIKSERLFKHFISVSCYIGEYIYIPIWLFVKIKCKQPFRFYFAHHPLSGVRSLAQCTTDCTLSGVWSLAQCAADCTLSGVWSLAQCATGCTLSGVWSLAQCAAGCSWAVFGRKHSVLPAVAERCLVISTVCHRFN